jgi:membrane-associated phospholipid phosphatase
MQDRMLTMSRIVTEAEPPTTETADLAGAHRGRRVGWRLGSLALAFATMYTLTVWTTAGQQIEDTGMVFSIGTYPRSASPWTAVYDSINVVSLAGGLALLLLLGYRRNRPKRGRIAVGIVVVSLTIAELLKRVILPRPNLAGGGKWLHYPSFPSGHTTIALGFTVAALSLSSARHRPLVALVGWVYSVLMGVSLLATANHRLGDVLGSCVLITAMSIGVHHLARPSTNPDSPASVSPAQVARWLGRCAAVFAVGAVVWAVETFLPLTRGWSIVMLDPQSIIITEALVFAACCTLTVRACYRLQHT